LSNFLHNEDEAMPLTQKQNHLVQNIDARAKSILSAGSTDEELLISLAEVMGDIKKIWIQIAIVKWIYFANNTMDSINA
jgi:hypothetical protein